MVVVEARDGVGAEIRVWVRVGYGLVTALRVTRSVEARVKREEEMMDLAQVKYWRELGAFSAGSVELRTSTTSIAKTSTLECVDWLIAEVERLKAGHPERVHMLRAEKAEAERDRYKAALEKTEAAIREYHFALDSRQHGGVAQDKAIHAIETALELPWRQGEEKNRRAAEAVRPMRWKSVAEWPKGTTADSYGRCRSEDTHATKEQAEGVCGLLESRGFGGDGRVFPVRTWVEPVESV